TAEAPKSRFTTLAVALEQSGKSTPLFTLSTTPPPAGTTTPPPAGVQVTPLDANRIRITRPIGKKDLPELQAGAAKIVVTASRPSFLNLRTLSSSASRDFQVKLEPPRIAVLSTKHYVNHGGSEMVVYKATPADVQSGVRVGDVEYPGFPASGAVE